MSICFGGLVLIWGLRCLFSGPAIEGLLALLILLWISGSIGTSYWAFQFDCPRCGERFFKRRFSRNGFAQRCVHCGLPKWEEV